MLCENKILPVVFAEHTNCGGPSLKTSILYNAILGFMVLSGVATLLLIHYTRSGESLSKILPVIADKIRIFE